MSLDNHTNNARSTTTHSKTKNTPPVTGGLYQELMNVISTFSERKRQVILRRLGFNGTSESLESIGKDLSITRERVRQIELICFQAVTPVCEATLIKKLHACLTSRTEPLYLEALETEDEWFKGFAERQVFLEQIIEKLTNGHYHVFQIQKRRLVAKIDLEGWNHLKSETLTNLKAQIPAKISQKDVNRLIRRTATEHGVPELTQLLTSALQNKLHFGSLKGRGQKILCSVGRGISHVLMAILVEASEPLHYTELARRCSARLGRKVEAYVHNTLKELACLYGRGIYGTIDHFPLPETDKKNILAIAESIILQGPKARQWTCSELLLKLKSSLPNVPNELDKYILNIILSHSAVLKSVGRLVWIKKDGDHLNKKVSRIDLQEACTAIVEKAQQPISTHKIKEYLMQQRGVDQYFTIFPSPRIARIRPNVWGLIDRDFLLPKEQRQEILEALYHRLGIRQEGLHITELKKNLQEDGITLPSAFTNYMVMSLTQTDSRFKVRRGQIVGLSDWVDGKRITVKQAIDQIAKDMNAPLTMIELRQAVEEIVKHDVKQPLHRLLEEANIVYDEDSNTWNIL